jgi:hypothetical protein
MAGPPVIVCQSGNGPQISAHVKILRLLISLPYRELA